MAFADIGMMVFIVAAAYLAGGATAVRRQARRFVLLTVILVLVVLAVPVLDSLLGDAAWSVALIGLNVAAVLAFLYASRRSRRASVAGGPQPALATPKARALVIGWVMAITVGVILIALAAKAGY